MARAFNHPSTKDITIDGVLYALADPVRRGIVAKLIGAAGMNCSKACQALSPSTISFHYKILRETGLVRSEKQGVEVINHLRKDELDQRFPGLLDAILKHPHRPAKASRAGRTGRSGPRRKPADSVNKI